MNGNESLEQRQEEEVEVLKSIFDEDFTDLRQKDVWKVRRPPEFHLRIKPQLHDSKDQEQVSTCFVVLHFKLGTDYPTNVPSAINIHDSDGLSDKLKAELLSHLTAMAKKIVGEVMINELAQFASSWLHENRKPKGFASFYEEMEVLKKAEEDKKVQRLESERAKNSHLERQQLQAIRTEVAKKKEELKEERQKWKEEEKRRLLKQEPEIEEDHVPLEMNNKSQQRRILNQRRSSSTKSGSDSEPLGSSLNDLKFIHHGEKVKIDRLVKIGSNVLGGSVHLGHFSVGNATVAVKEWTLPTKTNKASYSTNVRVHDWDVLQKQLSSIEQELSSIQKLTHNNIVQYQALTYEKQKTNIKLFVVENFVIGSNLSFYLSENIPLDMEMLRYYCQGILEALHFMHSHNIVHRDLRESCVFLTQQGVVQVSDFSIDKRVRDLIQDSSEADRFPLAIGRGGKKCDIYRFGLLVLSLALGDFVQDPRLPKGLSPLLSDFLKKCLNRDEKERWSSAQLLGHTWLKQRIERSPLREVANEKDRNDMPSTDEDEQEENGTEAAVPFISVGTGDSRLQNEFKFISEIGKGGFGEVMKVRNNLDGQTYAIKKIKLNPKNKTATRKLMREVKLLSRLNHENVVRYYTSWIEVTTIKEERCEVETSLDEEESHLSSPTKATENKKLKKNLDSFQFKQPLFVNPADSELLFQRQEENDLSISFSSHLLQDEDALGESSENEDAEDDDDEDDDESEMDYAFGTSFLPQSDEFGDDDSGGIIFESSENPNDSFSQGINAVESFSGKQPKEKVEEEEKKIEIRMMYIQMEYCDKQTLRNAIDGGLYKDSQRLWRMFREIIEGLVHIHTQAMIHRDLKPVNIFIDSRDHVKIGDFGLATTNIIGEKNVPMDPANESLDVTNDMTGHIGTVLYTAPEIDSRTTNYTQKVDIYSLGVIFFEMCYPPLKTGMERIKVLSDLRSAEIKLPQDFDCSLMMQQTNIIKWLLNHDASKRPNSQELLQSDYLPPLQVEEAELRDMIRHTLANQKSKGYRHLIDSCISQEMNIAQDISYDMEDKPQGKKARLKALLDQEYVRRTAETVFHRHGALNVQVGNLLPRSKLKVYDKPTVVQVMTRGGGVVMLPYDLRVSFARFLARSQLNSLKRYCIGPVFREFKVFGYHPREQIECAFDIVTSSEGSHLADAEVLYTADELIRELDPNANASDYFFRLNHTQLLRGILMSNNVPEDMHQDIYNVIRDGSGWSKLQRSTHLLNLGLSEPIVTSFLNSLEHEGTASKISGILRNLIRKKNSMDIKQGLNDLDDIIEKARAMGMKCTVLVSPSLVYNPGHFSGMICQLVRKKKRGHEVLAAGGRYDHLINCFAANISLANQETSREQNQAAVGISFAMDKLVGLCREDTESFQAVDVFIYSENHMPSVIKEKSELANRLWNAGVKCVVSDIFQTLDELQESAVLYSASFIVIIREAEGFVRVRCLDKERFHEKKIPYTDLVEYITKNMRASSTDVQESYGSIQRSESMKIGTDSSKNISAQVNFNFRFLDKSRYSVASKKRLEAMISSKITSALSHLNPSSRSEVVILPFSKSVVKSVAVNLDLEDESAFRESVSNMLEKHVRHKKELVLIFDEIKTLNSSKKCDVIFLYSMEDHAFVPVFIS